MLRPSSITARRSPHIIKEDPLEIAEARRTSWTTSRSKKTPGTDPVPIYSGDLRCLTQDSIWYNIITDADKKCFIVPGTLALLSSDGDRGYRNNHNELLSLPPVLALCSS